jgi:hypothetical protein
VNVRNRLVLKSVRFQKVEPLSLKQLVDDTNFIFVYLMAALVSDWVPVIKLERQRLAILANMTNQKLVKPRLTELEPHYATDDFVNFSSIDQVVASVVDG